VTADVADDERRRRARLRHARDVRRKQDARMRPEGVVVRRRFRFQDVDNRPGEAPFIEGLQQVGLDEMAAPADIDQTCAVAEARGRCARSECRGCLP
jgi:hypothetical protein